jgi:hypothetical protein
MHDRAVMRHGRAPRSAGATVALAGLLLLALAGCSATLVPAPEAQRVPGPGAGAVAGGAGAQVSAHVNAWRGWPTTLDGVLTPVLVTLRNDGSVALRLRHDDFALVTADGARHVALALNQMTGFATEPTSTVAGPGIGLGVGIGSYRDWGIGSPFAVGGMYDYDFFPGYPLSVQVPLPSADMVRLALPEGAVDPGATAEGFLYFDRVTRKARRVTFEATIVTALTGERLGVVSIPFVTE